MECSPNELTAWYIEAGQVKVTTSRRKFTVRKGEWIFLPTGYRRQEFSDASRIFSVAFNVSWQDSHRPVLDLRPGLVAPSTDALDAAMKVIRCQRGNSEAFEWHFHHIVCDMRENFELQSWFLGWLRDVLSVLRDYLPELENSSEMDPRVDAARRWIEDQPEAQPIADFQGAASQAKLSLGHLNKLFLDCYHQSLHGFHEQRRFRYACSRLLEPDSRIKSVAYEMGFNDLSKFSNWFKRLKQVSPREYRRRNPSDAVGRV
ncbi:MAG: helix-turn-helix domain-containing protein [Puniceicoccales bacterium]